MEQKKVLLFAGTTEGRNLTEYLAQRGVEVYVCVATEYGESLIAEHENVQISHERLDCEQMIQLIEEFAPMYVVDATHPYARIVTQNIREACSAAAIPYLRLKREESETKDCVFVDSLEEAIDYLDQVSGNILATTGSKELECYTRLGNYKERVFARVLSVADVVKKCESLGFAGKHLICMQGPFSVELNVAMMRQYDISYLVTKESGQVGGFPEKYEAAKRANATLIVIGREAEEGESFEEICRFLSEKCQCEEVTPVAAENTIGTACKETSERQVSLIGIGTGNVGMMTQKAVECFKAADLILGARRMVEAVTQPNDTDAKSRMQKKEYLYKADEIVAYLRAHPEYKKIAIAFSGDVGFYSGAKKTYDALQKELQIEAEMIPGISSVAAFAAKLGVNWEDAYLTSIHGREEAVISRVRDHRKVFLLGGKVSEIQKLGEQLEDYGFGKLEVSIGSEISYETEQIWHGAASEMKDYNGSGLCVIYIENPSAGQRVQTGGISDEQFIRGKVPMTKEEIRSISLSKMRLRKNSIVYDVGAGTGSVSIEAALTATCGQVYAVEIKEEAVDLICKNKKKFGVDNLTVFHGEAPETLKRLPAPDCVFIGGSRGNLRTIIETVLDKGKKVQIVLNAIALETLAEITQYLDELERDESVCLTDEEVLQISVAKSKQIGKYHMMTGQNPIFIVSFNCEKVFLSKEE